MDCSGFLKRMRDPNSKVYFEYLKREVAVTRFLFCIMEIDLLHKIK